MPGIDELLEKTEGTDIKPQLDALANRCVEQLGMDYNDVMKYFQDEVNTLKGRMPAGTEDGVILRQAFVRTRGHYKGDLLSTAEAFTGIITGVGDKFDMVGRARREALEMWREKPDEAIQKGYVDAQGNPLDTRRQFASGKDNPNYGKPLPEHAYIRNLRGVAKKTDGELKRFTMPLSEERADIEIPAMVPVAFRANLREEKDEEFELNQWSRINFEKITTEDPDLQNVEGIMIENFQEFLCNCGNLLDYHARVQGDPQRYVLLNVDVDFVGEVNPTTNNQMMVVTDDSLPDDSPGITVWVPPHLQPLDFDAGSRIILGGSTVANEFQGEERAMINAQGIWVDPKYRVAPMPKGTTPAK